ncbi:MAG: glycoside hydrolase, partial [Chloroflexi bacterium]|nr:glycoside hydrolase [Chloroflexota bacterium]
MTQIKNISHQLVNKDPTLAHCYNQANVKQLRNGEVVAVYNEERFPYHHDTGQTVLIRSKDGGQTWDSRQVVLPYTSTTGNWDCGIAELVDGSLLVN